MPAVFQNRARRVGRAGESWLTVVEFGDGAREVLREIRADYLADVG
jgi:hypothetical protein